MIGQGKWSFKFFQLLIIVAFLLIYGFLSILMYNNSLAEINLVFKAFDDNFILYNNTSSSKYLVFTKKCKIPNMNPFHPQIRNLYYPKKYVPCSAKFPLTYVSIVDNTATLHLNFNVVSSYTKNNVSCCYSCITRRPNKSSPDDRISISFCREFKEKVIMENDFILVSCNDTETQMKIYENTHAAITLNKKVKKKMNKFINRSTSPYSVLFVGIDSVSRLNFIRSLPKTYRYLEKKGWLSLKGYNKIADNTFPNVMAILTGFNENSSYTICDPYTLDKLNQCPMIWYDYRKLGYITGYAEDDSAISTFNNLKKGFTQPPTDYYYRPYILGSENLTMAELDGMNYCTGPELAGERILNIAKDFVSTFKNFTTFSLYWMNSFSHNGNLNLPSRMDLKIKYFLKQITTSDVLNNCFIFFLSDHGIRTGEIRPTTLGWLEERLPFIYISVPNRFKTQYPVEFRNFKNQQNKLTNPYDIYMTLQHILVLSGFNHTIKPSKACPKCKSLFLEGDSDRSCEDAAIDQHWCTCAGYTSVSQNNEIVQEASKYIIRKIHEIIHHRDSGSKCAKYHLNQILASSVSESFTYKNDTYFLLVIETQPKALFEATVLYKDQMFLLRGEISRLDLYSAHSNCVHDEYLKKYCYCSWRFY